MRIAFVIPDVTRGYGTERTTVLLANTFVAQGHEVSILSIFKEEPQVRFPVDERVKICYLIQERYTHKNSLLSIARQYVRAVMALRGYFRKHAQDVIIGQTFLSNFFLWISGKSTCTFACEHYEYGAYPFLIRAFRNWMYRKFRLLVVLTEKDARKFISRHVRCAVIPNMISFPMAEESACGKKRMISVGRLHAQKGYDLLLYALKPVFEKYSDWSMDIYGEGGDRPMLEGLRDELGLAGNVNFRGFSTNIQYEYAHASFYVMSSRFEGFPMVLLEAMACGLPIVSFDCPNGPADLLAGDAGLLVEAGNIKALSEAIIRMIENPDKREMYAKNGLCKIRQYTAGEIYKRWEALFH